MSVREREKESYETIAARDVWRYSADIHVCCYIRPLFHESLQSSESSSDEPYASPV